MSFNIKNNNNDDYWEIGSLFINFDEGQIEFRNKSSFEKYINRCSLIQKNILLIISFTLLIMMPLFITINKEEKHSYNYKKQYIVV